MIIEAYDLKKTKFKIGMECHVFGKHGNWYIMNLKTNKSGELIEIVLVDKDLDFIRVQSTVKVYPTGKYEGDVLRLARKLEKNNL